MRGMGLKLPKASVHGGSIGQHSKGHGSGLGSLSSPRNRARSSTNIPRGGHKVTSSTTIPRLPRQLSVKDILHIKFPWK